MAKIEIWQFCLHNEYENDLTVTCTSSHSKKIFNLIHRSNSINDTDFKSKLMICV